MSQISYDEMSLQNLVDSSQVILRVGKAQPETHDLEIPMEGKDFQTGDPCGPFRKVIFRFRVEEILLHSFGPALEPGKEIGVARANWRQEFELLQRYCREGLSESPIYRAYTAAEEVEGDELFIFLHWEGGEWLFACEGAEENTARREEIQRCIRQRKRAGEVYPELMEGNHPAPKAKRPWWARLLGK